MNKRFAKRHWRKSLLAGLLLMSASAVSAQDEADIDVESASVMVIRKSLVERHTLLKEHFQAGVIGFTHDGFIAVREPGGLAQDIRAKVARLVADDNKDRGTLYREIARANGRPDWESQLQSVFAARWISRAPVGWHYRDASGHWLKKLSRGANDEAPATASLPSSGN